MSMQLLVEEANDCFSHKFCMKWAIAPKRPITVLEAQILAENLMEESLLKVNYKFMGLQRSYCLEKLRIASFTSKWKLKIS